MTSTTTWMCRTKGCGHTITKKYDKHDPRSFDKASKELLAEAHEHYKECDKALMIKSFADVAERVI